MKKILIIFGILSLQFSYSQTINSSELLKEAYSYLSSGKYEKSIEVLKKAIKIDSLGNCGTGFDGVAQNELGYSYIRIGKFDKARDYLDKSIELNPQYPKPRLNKTFSYLMEKDFTKATDVLDKFIEEIPGHPMAHWQKGNILEAEGKVTEAILEYRKARAFNRKLNLLPKSIVDRIEEKLKNN